METPTPQPGAPIRRAVLRRAAVTISRHAPKIMIATVAATIAQAAIGLQGGNEVRAISLALYVLAVLPGLVLVLAAEPRSSGDELSRLREMSPLAYLGYQIGSGQVDGFPPRLPRSGNVAVDDSNTSGCAVGGS